MKQINKNNYKQFLNHYNDFHDGYINKIENITEMSEIKIVFDVWSTGNQVLQDNGTKDKQTKLKMVFKNVNSFSENNPYMIDYIDYTYIDFYNQNGKSLIRFSLYDEDPDKEPYLYITCESIEYEEIE